MKTFCISIVGCTRRELDATRLINYLSANKLSRRSGSILNFPAFMLSLEVTLPERSEG